MNKLPSLYKKTPKYCVTLVFNSVIYISKLLKIKNFASLVFGNFNCKDLICDVFLQVLPKWFLSLVFVFFIFTSCGKKEVEVPDGIIKPETLTSIIVDLAIADAGQNVSYSAGNSKRYDIWVFYQASLEKNGVTQEQFMQSIDWYANHIKLLNEVYDNALIEINLMREKLSAENEL